MKKQQDSLTGSALAAKLLKEKLEMYQHDLSIQNLLQIHQALWREKPLSDMILVTLSNQFEFLEQEYLPMLEKKADAEKYITGFLTAFLQASKRDLLTIVTTNKDGQKLPG